MEAVARRSAVVLALMFWTVQGAHGDGFEAAGYTFSLVEEGDHCVATFDNGEHSGRLRLATPPPCQFVRISETGGLKHFSYEDVDIDAVIIVTGSPITDADRRLWKVRGDVFCGKAAQALLVRREGVVVSTEVMRGGIVCASTGVDEKRFYQFAHPPPRETPSGGDSLKTLKTP